ncbi:MAG: hypothetical protein JXA03_07355 [Bacteroidales bacterium]|nr:hypothetical protein [Bacteroidales bacterium]
MDKGREILQKHLPEAALDPVMAFLKHYKVFLKISRARTSKLGDYRPPIRYCNHRISVNYNLNPYHFLVTLLHEFAHLLTWEKYRSHVMPHGREWKSNYALLLAEYMNYGIFPPDLHAALAKIAGNPGYSTATDDRINKMLASYNREKQITLEDIPLNSVFRIHNGMVFIKLEKLKKRYRCKRLDNRRIYSVSPAMEVIPMEPGPEGSC